jgi:glutamyl-tRNA synthetase
LPHVVRFAVPLEGSTSFHDVIHGDVTWENRVLDDFVI